MVTGEGRIVVDCTDCKGKSDLGNRYCFKGIASRIQPGFKGEIVLSRVEEKGYSGKVVDLLTDYSDILSLLSSDRENRSRKLSRARDYFLDDPSTLLEKGPGLKKGLKDEEATRILNDILDKISLMMRKIEMDEE